MHEGKLMDEKSKSNDQRDDEKMSTETLPSQTSTDSDDAGATSSRSLSEREDSDITSSVSSVVDETTSQVTMNSVSASASTDEPQTSVESALEGKDGVEPSWSDDMSVEAGQSEMSMPSSAPPSSAPPLSDPPLSAPPSSAPPSSAPPSVQEHYFVKWITWKGEKTPIITQSENGPCPLLAIMNILFLRWKNMSDAMVVLPKLSTGLDVNVRFTGVSDFEYTPECIVFDLLDIPLYHGWLVDPQSPETASAVGKLSYNQLVEKIIIYKHSTDCSRVSEGLIAEQFLESTATQLSYHGLCELNTTAKEGELCVFFRNNHFSTMIKHKGHLYLLVTDQGFLQEDSVVWESLHNVEGDGNFCDSEFRLCHASQKSASRPTEQQQQMQIEQVTTSVLGFTTFL
ncbi:ubiquitin carboxyl-terminal hydrolase MINDY-1 [Silurus asotus]|uniref:Ubiquitin carboxyl-terminal hydrolase n=1 Tax=Silurus asotus TaxID=30991 RepID=A0AAD4ZZX4_SILAS|nr:ubiquitin carboxyl-terminal hydrolase MINDY-1 [Silurus asotus]